MFNFYLLKKKEQNMQLITSVETQRNLVRERETGSAVVDG